MSPSPCESVSSDAEDVEREDASGSSARMKAAVVILSSLPEYKIAGIRPPTPEQFYSEDESESSSDSDVQREDDSNDESACKCRRKRRKVRRSDASQRPHGDGRTQTMPPRHKLTHSTIW